MHISSLSNHLLMQLFTLASQNRIAYLDGLRALAILSVCLYKYYYTFPIYTEYAYDEASAGLPFAQYGWLGVMLFFAISGFVISQTLHTSATPVVFAVKRFARLFPAMLLCSVLTFAFSFVGPNIYQSHWINFIPSLTFIDPHLFNLAFKTHQFQWMDPSYWSLFTEVRFYLLAAIIYFYDKKSFYQNFLKLSIIVGILFPLAIMFEIKSVRSVINLLFIADQLPWFLMGIASYYLFHRENTKAITLMSVGVLSLSFYLLSHFKHPFMHSPIHESTQLVGAFVVIVILVGVIKVRFFGQLLSWKPIATVGLASYSLYLLHQHVGEKIIGMISTSNIVQPFTPMLVLLLMILVSQLIYHYYENPLNRYINHQFKKNRE